MGRTRTTLLASLLVLVPGSLAAGTAGAEARVNASAPLTCLALHHGATGFCLAVEHRVAIRTVRALAREEATRAHVEFRPRPAGFKLGWNVSRLKAANHWERARLKTLKALPTYIVRDMPAWMCLHRHEGAWNATGYYHGGLQMDWNFMRSYGRDMLLKYGGRGAEVWTPIEQITVAQRAHDSGRGYGPWPQTRLMCGV
jgi:hypothetical protein